MNALQKLAVAKVVKSKAITEASKQTDPGKYEIDTTVRVFGDLTKGEDFEKVIPNKVKWPLLAAILASKVNNETLDAVLAEYDAGEKSGSLDSMESKVKERVQLKIDAMKGEHRATVNGPVTTNLTVEVSEGSLYKIAKVG